MIRDATPEEYQETDYKYWLLKDVWGKNEASCLLNGVKPIFKRSYAQVNDEYLNLPERIYESVKEILAAIEFSIKTGVIKRESGNELGSHYDPKFYPNRRV